MGDEIARKINREQELKLSRWKNSSDVATDNVLVWDCTGAKKAVKGVLLGYRAAAIDPTEPFIATFEIDVDRGVFQVEKNLYEYLNIIANKKHLNDPVVFNLGMPMGH